MSDSRSQFGDNYVVDTIIPFAQKGSLEEIKIFLGGLTWKEDPIDIANALIIHGSTVDIIRYALTLVPPEDRWQLHSGFPGLVKAKAFEDIVNLVLEEGVCYDCFDDIMKHDMDLTLLPRLVDNNSTDEFLSYALEIAISCNNIYAIDYICGLIKSREDFTPP